MKKVFLGLLLSLLPLPTLAAECFTPTEIEAAEAISFHTDMMVSALTCRTMPQMSGLVGQYATFTQKHGKVFSAYEKILINHFARQGGNATKQFDAFRTKLANEKGLLITQIPRDGYCAAAQTLYQNWMPLDSKTIETYAQRRVRMEGAKYYACSKDSKAVKTTVATTR